MIFHVSFSDLGGNSDLVSCFQHLGQLKDDFRDDDMDEFPPEPFFCHPIAEALWEQAHNPEQLRYVPPSHHHNHDYVLAMNEQICAVVGEGWSGKDWRCELDKCLPGLTKSLTVLSKAVAMTSKMNKCTVSLGQVSGVESHGDEILNALTIDSIEIINKSNKSGYADYIMEILAALELFVRMIVDDPNDIYCIPPEPRKAPFLKPTYQFDRYTHGSAINTPGVYMGRNAAYVKEHYPDFYQLYLSGHDNRIAMQPFPQMVNNPTGDKCVVSLTPMECLHYDPGVTFDIEEGEEVSQQQLRGTYKCWKCWCRTPCDVEYLCMRQID